MKKSKVISMIIIIILITNMIFQIRSLANNEMESENITNSEENLLNNTSNNVDMNTVGNNNSNNTNANTENNDIIKAESSIVLSFFLKDGNITWNLNNNETINGYVGDEYNIETNSNTYASLMKSGNYGLSNENVSITGKFIDTVLNINVYLEIAKSSGQTNMQNNNSSAFGKDNENMIDVNSKENEEFYNMKNMLSQAQSDLSTANSTISSLTKQTTYQGSQNNYLKSLSINDVELKNEFKKTTNTYFASIDSSVSSITVKAVSEEKTSTVTVYGNTNLQSGTNKILINVTAEDGSIRTYRIYVTKQ